MRADLERHLRGIANVEIVLECCLHDHAERAERRARRDRIGRIGRDQQRRLVAAPHRPLEAARDLDAEQHLAGFQQIVEIVDVVHFVDEAEISGVLQRLQDRAGEIAVLLEQHRARKVVRRGVDGVAKQQELHHRQHHDHRERDAIALELDELLDQHRVGAPPEAEALADFARWSQMIGGAHWKLSLERPISSMNTSSSDGDDFCQCRPLFSCQGAMLASSAARRRRDRRRAARCRTAPPCRRRACR